MLENYLLIISIIGIAISLGWLLLTKSMFPLNNPNYLDRRLSHTLIGLSSLIYSSYLAINARMLTNLISAFCHELLPNFLFSSQPIWFDITLNLSILISINLLNWWLIKQLYNNKIIIRHLQLVAIATTLACFIIYANFNVSLNELYTITFSRSNFVEILACIYLVIISRLRIIFSSPQHPKYSLNWWLSYSLISLGFILYYILVYGLWKLNHVVVNGNAPTIVYQHRVTFAILLLISTQLMFSLLFVHGFKRWHFTHLFFPQLLAAHTQKLTNLSYQLINDLKPLTKTRLNLSLWLICLPTSIILLSGLQLKQMFNILSAVLACIYLTIFGVAMIIKLPNHQHKPVTCLITSLGFLSASCLLFWSGPHTILLLLFAVLLLTLIYTLSNPYFSGATSIINNNLPLFVFLTIAACCAWLDYYIDLSLGQIMPFVIIASLFFLKYLTNKINKRRIKYN